MAEFRNRIAERPIYRNLSRRVGEMLLRADDVRAFHQSVVNHDGEIVNGNAVRFHDDKITDAGRLKFHVSAHHIIESVHFVRRHAKPHDRFPPFRFVFLALLFRKMLTTPAIDRRFPFRELRLSLFFQLFLRAIAIVRFAFRNQALHFFFVERKALRLAIRTVLAADVDTLVPIEPQPAERFFDIFLRFPAGTRQVRILNAHQKFPARVTREKPIKESTARPADMKRPRRARRKTYFQICFHHILLPLFFIFEIGAPRPSPRCLPRVLSRPIFHSWSL